MDSFKLKPLLAAVASSLLFTGCANTMTKSGEIDPVFQKNPPITHVEPLVKQQRPAGSATHGAMATNYSEPAPLSDNAPQQYTVKKGDTLWDIAGRFLSDPWYWPEIWHVNPEIKNPHLIYPGDIISLFYVDGQPRLAVNYSGPSGSRKLSPQIRVESIDGSNGGLAISSVRPFLHRPQVVTLEEMSEAGHVLDSDENRLIYGSGDRVYTHGLTNPTVGDRYSIFRTGQPLLDPERDNAKLGYHATYTAEAKVVSVEGQVATIIIENAVREVLRGDRLLPADPGAQGMFFWPQGAPSHAKGQIIAITDALSSVAQLQIIAINLGALDGIEPGHVFEIQQRGRSVSDPRHRHDPHLKIKLPDEKIGVLMAYRIFDHVSYGLIMDATRPVRKGDTVLAP